MAAKGQKRRVKLNVLLSQNAIVDIRKNSDRMIASLKKIQKSGYDGILLKLAGINKNDSEVYAQLFAASQLACVVVLEHQGTGPSTQTSHSKQNQAGLGDGNKPRVELSGLLRHLEGECLVAKDLGAKFIISRIGHDWWSDAEAQEFLKGSLEVSKKIGIEIAHETQRCGIFRDPWKTLRILNEIPEISLCPNLSEWFCASGRIYNNKEDALWFDSTMAKIARNCIALAARISDGTEAQVFHPQDPAHRATSAAHARCWKKLWLEITRLSDNDLTLYAIPVHEATPRNHIIPFSRKCHGGDETEVNDWIKQELRDTFEKHVPGAQKWKMAKGKDDELEKTIENVISRGTKRKNDFKEIIQVSKQMRRTVKHYQRNPMEEGSSVVEENIDRVLYSANDDETPKMIAKKFMLDLKPLTDENKIFYKSLSSASKLLPKTIIVLPISAAKFIDKRAEVKPEVPEESHKNE
eukprot:m.210587 g.210587  ORF g.210587 m.210587 type:complete len:466 (-) comp15824_c0_seq1:3076-4473(-)